MPNLRLLQIIGAQDIKGNFKDLFPQLRCIRWHSAPWTHIPSMFSPQNLVSFEMPFSKLKILWKTPMAIKQLTNLGCLYLRECRDLKQLPEQLGEMKGLKMIDVSYSEQLGEIKGLKDLDASFSEQIGIMKSLEILELSRCENLTNLPDSIWMLKSLKKLHLNECSKLDRLPEQLGEMQCLESLFADGTAIELVPDSIGLLSKLQVLGLDGCQKLKYVPESIWNLTTIQTLYLESGDIGIISLPDSVEELNELTSLHLRCNLRSCLPMILRLPSLEDLTLSDEGQILSSAEPVSLTQLLNLRVLRLNQCTSFGSSLPELPLNLEELYLCDHSSLEQLPDLSSLKLLEHLHIKSCISLKSISSLPSHLYSLSAKDCASLQDLPDLSMLKGLGTMSFIGCNNLKSTTLKQSFLEAGHYFPFSADLPDREVAEWFDYKSSGNAVSFEAPSSFGANFLGLALWLVYTCKASDLHGSLYIKAVITNVTEDITENYPISVRSVVGEAQSRVECIPGEEIFVESGENMKVSIHTRVYSDFEFEVPVGQVKVKMCGVHVIQDEPSTQELPSFSRLGF